jgi:hypothetical protein
MATHTAYTSLSPPRISSPIEQAGTESLNPQSDQSSPHTSSPESQPLSDTTGRENEGLPSKKPKKKERFDWTGSWVWEIASATSSVICIALLMGFLAYINGASYEDWQYHISPNAVVSVIATAAKAAMIIPVSSCLGQIKWNQYRSHTHTPLYHMQVLDQASRGPWGACEVLWTVTPGLATAGAILMILSVAIDPFSQQILAFPSRNVAAGKNETALIQKTHEYSPPWALNGSDTVNINNILVTQTLSYNLDAPLLVAILSGLSLQNKPLDPVCTTGRCRYPDFVSLGICSDCFDVTQQTTQKCSASGSGSWFGHEWSLVPDMCNYTSPNNFTFAATPKHFGIDDDGYTAVQNPWTSRTRADGARIWGIQNPILSFFGAKYPGASLWTLDNYTRPETKPAMTECTVYFCEKEYTPNTFIPGHSIQPSRTQQLLRDLTPPKETKPLSSDAAYVFNELTFAALVKALENLLNTTIAADEHPSDLDISTILYTQDNISESITAMADSMTDVMRRGKKAVMVEGQALRTETFIHVRWMWIIFTATIVTLSIVLLAATVIVSRGPGVVLWKSSVLPLLISHVQPRPEHDMHPIRNVDELGRIAKKTKVLMEDEPRKLLFVEN